MSSMTHSTINRKEAWPRADTTNSVGHNDDSGNGNDHNGGQKKKKRKTFISSASNMRMTLSTTMADSPLGISRTARVVVEEWPESEQRVGALATLRMKGRSTKVRYITLRHIHCVNELCCSAASWNNRLLRIRNRH